jgi:hypothetical protein
MLKGPGAKRLKLTSDEVLSSFAFKFNFRRYNLEIQLNVTGYTSGARGPDPGPAPHSYGGSGHGGAGYVGGGYGGGEYVSAPSYPPPGGGGGGAWDTFYTNEGVPYYVNGATGVTQWEAPQ